MGVEEKVFDIHSSVVTSMSPVLTAMIQGNYLEGIEKNARLVDTDEDTFVSFCEFCYTGDYSFPEPVIDDCPLSKPLSDIPNSEEKERIEARHQLLKAPPGELGEQVVFHQSIN